ncbi:isocitrate lyase/phosphoenolpyruvate mutase family protein [Streptomyces sp. NPDC005962]|uniref:isocitrate lyase/PEP mutase family protein n=1 Tax=Streptomyces sp. NPDC005962 TaxID=3154466 RepID=UPI0033D6DCC6
MTASATAEARAFRAMHHGRDADAPLVLPGPWDAGSARAFADAGFPALATPSAGVSASLGYQDGRIPAREMFAAVARIVRAVEVPVSADLESGYGLDAKELVERLLETGAVGCNLEDSDPLTKRLADPREQADRLAAIRAEAGDGLVINARIDTFVHGESAPGDSAQGEAGSGLGDSERAAEVAIERGRAYAAAGADCVYPIFAPPELLPRLAAAIGVPVNAAAFAADGPSPAELGRLGAARVTFGPRLFRATMAAARELAQQLGPAPSAP